MLYRLTNAWSNVDELARLERQSFVYVISALNGLVQHGQAEKHPAMALWRRKKAVRTVVFVDLGNVHDCLQQLLPLSHADLLEVRAYADLAFNGFGVNPPIGGPNCHVHRSASADKNAADVKLIWDVAQLCAEPEPCRFLVVTRDHGFRSLERLAAEAGHLLSFSQDWASLREQLYASENGSSRNASLLSEMS